jgi:hypothetical protein
MKFKVFRILKAKTKFASLGFDRDTAMSVAANIADNLEVEDDATPEELDAAVTTALEQQLPTLKLLQSQFNKGVEVGKKKKPTDKTDDDPEDDDPEDDDPEDDDKNKGAKKSGSQKKDKDEMPAWAQKVFDKLDSFEKELATSKTEKTKAGRRKQLEELVKDTGLYGKRILKSFDRMELTNEQFEEYLDEITEEVGELGKDAPADSSKSFGSPLGGGASGAKKDKEASDAEIEELAGKI